MKTPLIYRNKYFWLAITFFWLAMHAIFVHIQYNTSKGTEYELSWGFTWLLMSPWFLSWIWVTAFVHWVVQYHESSQKLQSPVQFRSMATFIAKHGLWMIAMLSIYWMSCSALRILMMGESLSMFGDKVWGVVTSSAHLDILIYLSLLFSNIGIRTYHAGIKNGIDLKRLQHALTQEQLKTLRSQLNPHFLFNALNTIASLVRLHREKDAVSALSELSHMLRKVLENKNSQNVSIRDEIAFVNSYLSIQKMRFADKLDTHITVAPECLDIEIPNMLLHPLIENAVEHGSQLESNRNLLKLEIYLETDELIMLLTNKVAMHDTHSGFGIGLTNTRERLRKLYGDFRLELKPTKNNHFETLLAIPTGVGYVKSTNS